MSKYSKAATEAIGAKIKKMEGEDRPRTKK